MDEAERWRAVGERLRQAREAIHPAVSKREAARRAGFAEITWRQLEAGERQIAKGLKVPMSATDSTVISAARALKIDPAELFEILGREYKGSPEPPPATDGAVSSEWVDAVEARLNRLEESVDAVLARLEGEGLE